MITTSLVLLSDGTPDTSNLAFPAHMKKIIEYYVKLKAMYYSKLNPKSSIQTELQFYLHQPGFITDAIEFIYTLYFDDSNNYDNPHFKAMRSMVPLSNVNDNTFEAWSKLSDDEKIKLKYSYSQYSVTNIVQFKLMHEYLNNKTHMDESKRQQYEQDEKNERARAEHQMEKAMFMLKVFGLLSAMGGVSALSWLNWKNLKLLPTELKHKINAMSSVKRHPRTKRRSKQRHRWK